jgi:menaquinol-cytochrome c reductase iron-sulfur subunit
MQRVETPAADRTTRRNLFIAAIFGLWSLIAGALLGPAFAYLFLPPRARKNDEWFEIGDISTLRPGVPVEMMYRRNRRDGWKVISEKSTSWVVKLPAGEVVAFGPQCTHLGCAYHWDADKSEFLCPCHSSLFSIDGSVVTGPAPRPLDRFETRIDSNKLLIGPLREGGA